MAQTATDIGGKGKLFALQYPYELSGREVSHPLDVRGWTTSNLMLFVEADRALLFSTGYSVHQEALLADLDRLVGSRPLSIVVPRAEFAAMCNARPIADRFDVDIAYLRIPSPPVVFLNFRPQYPQGPTDGLANVPYELIERGHRLPVDLAGTRVLEILSPELRLLPNSWGYDAETKTLLSSDIFTWIVRATADGPWTVSGDDAETTTAAQVEHALVHNRYWWLPGGDVDPVRASMADLFDTYDIEVVAPDNGPLLTGAAIQRHYQLLDDFLAKAGTMPAIGVAAADWRATA